MAELYTSVINLNVNGRSMWMKKQRSTEGIKNTTELYAVYKKHFQDNIDRIGKGIPCIYILILRSRSGYINIQWNRLKS